MKTIYTPHTQDLSRLTELEAVRYFRDLLWCSARVSGIPVTKVYITENVKASDGGIDAAIADDVNVVSDDLLVSPGTLYQIKTGTVFKPWQLNQLKKELFGSTKAKVCTENLSEAIKNGITHSRKYIIVCFGIDPTFKQLMEGKKLLRNCLKECGFKDAGVDIWGQTQLIGLIKKYPSLCLSLLEKAEDPFQTFESWSSNSDMNSNVVLGVEQEELIGAIKDDIRSNNYYHIRLIGEPGIGKTRLILEALRDQDLAPNVVYVRHPDDFQNSSLFNEMLRIDSSLYVILVIDECPLKEMSSIWNLLKGRKEKCKLITLDHGPSDYSDEWMKIYHCPALSDKQVREIISQYIESQYTDHWAKWCDGSPRVAHAVGQNLKMNPTDILKSPATVPIWDRFIAGYENISSELNQQRLTVLRHIALFYKFGFESPVELESQFIAKQVEKVDPNITWSRFQSIISHFKERRIIQGKTTLFIVPRALHIYLWMDFWKHYGRGFVFIDFYIQVPQSLGNWFMQMFIYAHGNEQALKIVNNILEPGGLFDDEDFTRSERGSQFLSVLAEANPYATLKCIERTIGKWDKETLFRWRYTRQNVVWALEKIAVWKEYFARSAKMLLMLSAAETESNSNNATGTFAELFSLGYGPLATTEATPNSRWPVLRYALESKDADVIKVALKACERALAIHQTKIIGPEYQGLRPVADLWMPTTWGEFFDAYRDAWNLVFNISRNWDYSNRRAANDILVNSARSLLNIVQLRNFILSSVKTLAYDEASNKKSIIEFLTEAIHFDETNLNVEDKEKLLEIDNIITGNTIESKVKRYTIYTNWNEDDYRKITGKETIPNMLKQLASELIADEKAFDNIVEELLTNSGNNTTLLGTELAKLDYEYKVFNKIIDKLKVVSSKVDFDILGGYLAGLRKLDKKRWEEKVAATLNDDVLQKYILPITWCGGVNDNIVEQMINLYKNNIINSSHFKLLRYTQKTDGVSSEYMMKVLYLLDAAQSLDASGVAIEILHAHYCREEKPIEFPKDLAFKIIRSAVMFVDRSDTMKDFYWKLVTSKFLSAYPEESLTLFTLIISRLDDANIILSKTQNPFHQILEAIIKSNPNETWDIIKSKIIKDNGYKNSKIVRWLSEDSPIVGDRQPIRTIIYFPLEAVFKWIDENPITRAVAIADAMPKTLDQSEAGRFTREFIHRYGEIEYVFGELYANFFWRGWIGERSIHNRKMRDEARTWLENETSLVVINWIEKYIDELNKNILESEIVEERDEW